MPAAADRPDNGRRSPLLPCARRCAKWQRPPHPSRRSVPVQPGRGGRPLRLSPVPGGTAFGRTASRDPENGAPVRRRCGSCAALPLLAAHPRPPRRTRRWLSPASQCKLPCWRRTIPSPTARRRRMLHRATNRCGSARAAAHRPRAPPTPGHAPDRPVPRRNRPVRLHRPVRPIRLLLPARRRRCRETGPGSAPPRRAPPALPDEWASHLSPLAVRPSP